MKLNFQPEEERFREDVRTFLDRELTPDLCRYAARMTSVYSDKDTALAWQAILVKQGWAAPGWPVEYGGCDWSVAQRARYEGAEGPLPAAHPVG